jgi:hypothetical protein
MAGSEILAPGLMDTPADDVSYLPGGIAASAVDSRCGSILRSMRP